MDIVANAFQARRQGYDDAEKMRLDQAKIRSGRALAGGDVTGAQNAFNNAGMVDEAFNVGANDRKLKQYDNTLTATSALASGDYAGAGKAYGAAGDRGGVEAAQTAETTRSQKDLEVTAKASAALRQTIKDHGPQSAAPAWDQLTPVLRDVLKINPDTLAKYREAFVANPEGFLDTIDAATRKQQEAYTLTQGQTRYGPNNEVIASVAPEQKYLPVPEGGKLVPVPNGAPGAAPVPGPAGAPAAGQPRNQRNNNPGNIEDGPFARSQPGYKGSDGRFAIFETPEAGQASQVALLGSYGKRGIDTVGGVVNRWAPASDNNDTAAYTKYVEQKIGVKPGQKIDLSDPVIASDIATAMGQFEGGAASSSNGPPALVAPGGDPPGTIYGNPKPKRGYRDATPEELRAQGYEPGSRAQVDTETGKLENIKRPTDGQIKATGYTKRVMEANDRMNKLADAGLFKPETASSQLFQQSKNGVVQIVTKSNKDRQFIQAAKEWLAPILRKDTGAAVTDSELATYMDIYIPRYEDDQATIKQKAEARQTAMTSLSQETGGVYGSTYGDRKFSTKYPSASKSRSAGGKRPALDDIFGD